MKRLIAFSAALAAPLATAGPAFAGHTIFHRPDPNDYVDGLPVGQAAPQSQGGDALGWLEIGALGAWLTVALVSAAVLAAAVVVVRRSVSSR